MQSFVQFIVLFLILSGISFSMSYVFGTLKKYPNFMVPVNFFASLATAIVLIYLI